MHRVIVYVHGSKRVGKTTLSEEIVRLSRSMEMSADAASIIGALRSYIKDTYGLSDDHVHGDLKETPLPHFGGVTTRDLMDELVGWHFKRDSSRMCFVRGCMADLTRRSDTQVLCIQDVIHEHEPPYIRDMSAEAGIACIGVHISRPGHTDTYGVNMSPDEFDYSIQNDGSLEELLAEAEGLFRTAVLPLLCV